MNVILNQLQNDRRLWHANQTVKHDNHFEHSYSSGYSALDKKLNGGIPKFSVVDIQHQLGIGELRFLIPSLLEQASADRLLVFIAPPLNVNAEMLVQAGFELSRVIIINVESYKQALWATEKCLKSGCCFAVLSWLSALEVYQVKRFKLAAKEGQSNHFVFRQNVHDSLPVPVNLTMKLSAENTGIKVNIPKRIGGRPIADFVLNMEFYWPDLTLSNVATTAENSNVLKFPNVRAN